MLSKPPTRLGPLAPVVRREANLIRTENAEPRFHGGRNDWSDAARQNDQNAVPAYDGRVSSIIAVGSRLGLGGNSPGWDFWPLLGIVGCLLLVRFVIEVRIRIPFVLGSVISGSVFASVVNVWGVAAGLGLAIALAFVVRLILSGHPSR